MSKQTCPSCNGKNIAKIFWGLPADMKSIEVEKNIKLKNILEVGHGKRYRINLSIRDEKLYLGNKENDLSFYFNNWSLIK